MNVYAPNDTSANAAFWEEIHTYLVLHPILKPNVLGGNTNIVEDRLDQMPLRQGGDPPAAVNALDELKVHLRLRDRWREMFPDTKDFMYYQRSESGSKSQIDHLYISSLVLKKLMGIEY